MKWNTPKWNQKRHRWKFLLIPCQCMTTGKTRWLEWAYVRESYHFHRWMFDEFVEAPK